MSDFEVNAVAREELGKGPMRRLRRTGGVPGILYGGGDDPLSITLRDNELRHQASNEAFFSHILTVSVGGKKTQAVLMPCNDIPPPTKSLMLISCASMPPKN